jgi:hypothetical protein
MRLRDDGKITINLAVAEKETTEHPVKVTGILANATPLRFKIADRP